MRTSSLIQHGRSDGKWTPFWLQDAKETKIEIRWLENEIERFDDSLLNINHAVLPQVGVDASMLVESNHRLGSMNL